MNDCGTQLWADAAGNRSATARQTAKRKKGAGILETVLLPHEAASFAAVNVTAHRARRCNTLLELQERWDIERKRDFAQCQTLFLQESTSKN